MDENNRIRMIKSKQSITIAKAKQYGSYVSVFAYMGKAHGVNMTGFKYPLSDALLEGDNTLTVSNEIIEDNARISIDEGYLIVCESKD